MLLSGDPYLPHVLTILWEGHGLGARHPVFRRRIKTEIYMQHLDLHDGVLYVPRLRYTISVRGHTGIGHAG